LPTTFPYGCNGLWASIYTSDQGANYGALFCSFNVGGQANKAQCYFKDISGNIPDQFEITSFMGTALGSPPNAQNDAGVTTEDTSLNINVLANDSDPDGGKLFLDSFDSTSANGGTVTRDDNGTPGDTSDDQLVYTPSLNFNGIDTFNYSVSDGTQSDTGSVTVTVTAVNDQPTADNQSVTTQQDIAVSITLTASDIDGDPLTYTVVSGPTNGLLTGTAPNLTYTPNPSFVGNDIFTFVANDGTVYSNTATVSISVNELPPPTTVLYSDNFDDNNISEYQQLGSSWTTVLETGKGYVLRHTANGNTIIFPPNESFNNNYQVKAQIWNGDNDAAGLAFRVNTSDGDNFYSCSASADSAFNAGIWQHVNDLDGTPTSQLATKPWSYVTGRWYTITVTINQDSSTINCIWEGEAGVELNLTVSDPNPLASGSVGIWLSHQNNFKGDLLEVRTLGPTEANQAPTANAGPDKTVSDSDGTGAEPVTLIGSGTDPDGTIASYEWKEGATVLGTTASITSNFLVGIHTVTLTVKDDGGATGTDTVLVTVQANQAPIVEFSDSFEDATLNKWVQDSQKDWFVSTQRARDGSRTAEVDGSANGATITVNSPVNLQGKISAKLTYSWFIESNWDSGEYICLDIFSNGIWNNGVPGTSRCLDGDVVAEEGQWHDVSLDLSSYLTNDFKIKFRAKVSGSSEDGNVDKVIVTSIS